MILNVLEKLRKVEKTSDIVESGHRQYAYAAADTWVLCGKVFHFIYY